MNHVSKLYLLSDTLLTVNTMTGYTLIRLDSYLLCLCPVESLRAWCMKEELCMDYFHDHPETVVKPCIQNLEMNSGLPENSKVPPFMFTENQVVCFISKNTVLSIL